MIARTYFLGRPLGVGAREQVGMLPTCSTPLRYVSVPVLAW